MGEGLEAGENGGEDVPGKSLIRAENGRYAVVLDCLEV